MEMEPLQDFHEIYQSLAGMGILQFPWQLEVLRATMREVKGPNNAVTMEELAHFYFSYEDRINNQWKVKELELKLQEDEVPRVEMGSKIPLKLRELHTQFPQLIDDLQAMGFVEDHISTAVSRHGNDLDKCVDCIFALPPPLPVANNDINLNNNSMLPLAQPAPAHHMNPAPNVLAPVLPPPPALPRDEPIPAPVPVEIPIIPMEKEYFKPVMKDCGICGTTYPINDLLTLNCDHRFCTECFEGYCQSKIVNAQVEITCPMVVSNSIHVRDHKLCNEAISIFELQANLPEELFQRYERFALNSFFQANAQDHTRCPKCNEWFIELNRDEAHVDIWCSVTCGVCKHKFCGGCGELPHRKQKEQNVSCADFAKWKEENDKVDDLLKTYVQVNRVKHCPSCKTGVELGEGCKFMPCRCGTKFCYLCGCKLNESKHFTHFNKKPFGDECLGPTDCVP